MESTDSHDANNVASARADVELIEEETNFANEVSDGELEAAASGPTVTRRAAAAYRRHTGFISVIFGCLRK